MNRLPGCRLYNHLQERAEYAHGLGLAAYVIKLTPLQSLELATELGYVAETLDTVIGTHQLKRIYCNTRALEGD